MHPNSDKRAVSHFVSDDAARGIELAITPVIFGGIGWLVDVQLGTGPWFALGLGAFAVVGIVLKMWFGYDAEMRQHESTSRWARRSEQAPAADAAPSVDLWADRKAQA